MATIRFTRAALLLCSLLGLACEPVPGEELEPSLAEDSLALCGPQVVFNVVTDGGLDNTGASNVTGALQDLVNATNGRCPNTYLLFPGGTYRVDGTVNVNRAGVKLISGGAVIDHSSASSAGDLFILGATTPVSDVEIRGFTFRGRSDLGGYRRFIVMGSQAERNSVVGCRFEEVGPETAATFVHDSSVMIGGKYNQVRGNTFDHVQCQPVSGGHYGSIQLNGDWNSAVDNVVLNFKYSGISSYAGDHNLIRGNLIRGYPGFPANAVNSMGVYLIHDASYNVVEGNQIQYVQNECLAMINSSASPQEHNIARGNQLSDCKYTGVSLQKLGSGAVQYAVVSDNQITAAGLPAGLLTGHGILLDGAASSTIRGNEVRGSGKIDRGITVWNSGAQRNLVEGNVVDGTVTYGISLNGNESILTGNHVSGTPVGLSLAWGQKMLVAWNQVSATSSRSIDVNVNLHGSKIADNELDRKPTISSTTHGADLRGNEPSTFQFAGEATLSGGTVQITTDAVCSGNSDAVIEVYTRTPSGVPGALYVSAINRSASPC